MSVFVSSAFSLANLLLAVRYPFPLYISGIDWYEQFMLQAALKLAPQLQAAQANRIEDVYWKIVRHGESTAVLYGDFAPEVLCRNLSEQHLLCSLPVLACAKVNSTLDEQDLKRALHAIRDRLGYAFFESTIHACVGHAQVSQEATIWDCIRLVCKSFPDDILSLAQRYGDLMIRLHGAEPFLTMLGYWCDHQAHVSQEALVEAFDSPLTRAAAMILDHPNLSPIKSSKTVEAAFDALSLADRVRLLVMSSSGFNNTRTWSVESKLRLLGFEPSIQTAVRNSSDRNEFRWLVRCLLHIPDPRSVHVVLEQACKLSWDARNTLITLSNNELRSDEARTHLAQVLINAPNVLYDAGYDGALAEHVRKFARRLPDASLRAALEARLVWQEQIYNLSKQCVNAVAELITNRFGAQLKRLRDDEVYDAMLQDHAWLSVVDETIANILGSHSLMNTMYGISSDPEQGV